MSRGGGEAGVGHGSGRRQLLELLAEGARMPLTGLAQRLGLARSTVQVRLALVRCLTPVNRSGFGAGWWLCRDWVVLAWL